MLIIIEGLEKEGKSTIARLIEKALLRAGLIVNNLDNDECDSETDAYRYGRGLFDIISKGVDIAITTSTIGVFTENDVEAITINITKPTQ
jgi:hypothetical protein